MQRKRNMVLVYKHGLIRLKITAAGNLYPYFLKQRVLGPNGHLSNCLAADAICKIAGKNLSNIMLRSS